MSRVKLLVGIVVGLLTAALLLVGLGAVLHLGGLSSAQPWVRVATVEGASMEPILEEGDRIICLRLPWREGSVVLADTDEDGAVIKRVVGVDQGRVLLGGDNRSVSVSYQVEPAALRGVMVCHYPLRPPSRRSREIETD